MSSALSIFTLNDSVIWRGGDDGGGRQVVVSAAESNCRLVDVFANLPCNSHCAASPDADDYIYVHFTTKVAQKSITDKKTKVTEQGQKVYLQLHTVITSQHI